MRIIQKLFMMLCLISAVSAADAEGEELNIQSLRAMPNIALQSDEIINLLSGSSSKVGRNGRAWTLLETSFTGDVGRIDKAKEISTSSDFDWLFYVTTKKDGHPILVLQKMFNAGVWDELLLISTPVTDDFADNPWVKATTISGELTDTDTQMLIKLFEPFMRKQ